jgi:hypothetical protein
MLHDLQIVRDVKTQVRRNMSRYFMLDLPQADPNMKNSASTCHFLMPQNEQHDLQIAQDAKTQVHRNVSRMLPVGPTRVHMSMKNSASTFRTLDAPKHVM